MAEQSAASAAPQAAPVVFGHPFIDFVGTLRRGTLLDDAAEALQEVTQAVQETGKPGTVTIQFQVRPASKHDATMLVIRDKVSAKTPEPDRAETVFFATDDGQLSRRDPRQPELPGLVHSKPMPNLARDDEAGAEEESA